MRKIFIFISLFFVGLSYSQNHLVEDTSFNTFSLPSNNYFVNSNVSKVLVQPDGKHLIAQSSKLVRLQNNILDTTFNTGAGFNGDIKDFLLQPDGKIVVVGAFTTYDGFSSKYIARLNQDGSRDTSFVVGTGFTVQINSPYTYVSSIALQADGKLVAVGDLAKYNETFRNYVIRLNADGSIDPNFSIDNNYVGSDPTEICIQPDGKLIVAGNGYLNRLNTDGSKDTAFYNFVNGNNSAPFMGSSSFVPDIYALKLQPDGKILVGGAFDSVYGNNYKDIVRLNTDGTLDTTFNNNGFINNANNRLGVQSILLQDDGKIILGGDFSKYGSQSLKGLVRVNSNATRDASFVGVIYDNFPSTVFSLDKYPDGNIMIGGGFNMYNNIAVSNIVKVDSDGNKLDTFNNICKGFNGSVHTITPQTDGKYLVGGFFHSYNGQTRNRIARINSDGSLDTDFVVNTFSFLEDISAPFDIKVQPDGKILVASNGRYFNGIAGGSLVRLNQDGSLDPNFNFAPSSNIFGLSGGCTSVAVLPDGKILAAGNLHYFSGSPVGDVVRFNSDGSYDTSFVFSSPFSYVKHMLVQPDGAILVSGVISGLTKMIRLLPDGTQDTSFTFSASINDFSTFELQPDGKILLSFDKFANQHTVKRINSNGSLDNSFSFTPLAYFSSYNNSLEVQPDGKILLAVPYNSSYYTTGIIRANSNGSIDTNFSVDQGCTQSLGLGNGYSDLVGDIKIEPNGKVIVGGRFRKFNGETYNGLVRLKDVNLNISGFTATDWLLLYPNPVEDQLYIDNKNQDVIIQTVSVYNSLGQLVLQKREMQGIESLRVGSLFSGTYFIKMETNCGIVNSKFLKK